VQRKQRTTALRKVLVSAIALLLVFALAGGAAAETVVIAPQITYLHRNATGDVVARSNEDGSAAVYQADVRPFSDLRVVLDQVGAPGRFLGQNREETTGPDGGLVRLGARMYAPYSGRFLTPDPLSVMQFPLTNPQAFNRYSYALNNPYRYHDASGLKPKAFSPEDTRVLMNFLHRFEGKLPGSHTMSDRLGALFENPAWPSDPVWATNNRPIQNRLGQEVDLDWGIRIAATSVTQAIAQGESLAGLQERAEFYATANFYYAKHGWNGAATALTWAKRKLGRDAKDQVGPFSFSDPNFLAVLLLVDFIVNGGDLRSYFSAEQIKQVEKLEKRESSSKAKQKPVEQVDIEADRFSGAQEHLQ
jgi:RHS repeat-associated protein